MYGFKFSDRRNHCLYSWAHALNTGEFLIFKRMRQGSIISTQSEPLLRERHVHMLWASWHTCYRNIYVTWHVKLITKPLPSQWVKFTRGALVLWEALVLWGLWFFNGISSWPMVSISNAPRTPPFHFVM